MGACKKHPGLSITSDSDRTPSVTVEGWYYSIGSSTTAWSCLLAPGLLDVGRQLHYIFCELCETSVYILFVHLLHGSLHVAVLQEKLVRRPCLVQQFRRPVFRDHCGCPEQLATDDELLLRSG